MDNREYILLIYFNCLTSISHPSRTVENFAFQLVTKKTSRLLNTPNEAGKTPLHLACEADKPECVKALLCAGADVNVAATHDSVLPIHSAMAANSTMCAKEIITMYPNQLNVTVTNNTHTHTQTHKCQNTFILCLIVWLPKSLVGNVYYSPYCLHISYFGDHGSVHQTEVYIIIEQRQHAAPWHL